MEKTRETCQQGEPEKELRADLGLISALSLVVGMVLGAGAFMKPPAVLAATGDFYLALTAWLIGGLVSISAGLTVCELGVMFPRTGGVFIFLEEIYGSKIAFLYGWMLTVVFAPAGVGALAGYFSSVFCLLFGVPQSYHAAVCAGVLAFVALVNCSGVKNAGYLQTVATACKLLLRRFRWRSWRRFLPMMGGRRFHRLPAKSKTRVKFCRWLSLAAYCF